MPSKYRVHINFKNKLIYDHILKGAKRANTKPGKFAEQLIEKEINRSIMHYKNDDIDLKGAYYEITCVKSKEGLMSRPTKFWPGGVNKDYTVEEFNARFIKSKKINRTTVSELIKDEIINLKNYPDNLIKSLADITLILIKEVNVNILDIKKSDHDEKKYQPKIRVALNYEAEIVPVYLGNNILEINILDIKHYTFAQLFQENRAYHLKKLFCVQITRKGGYFLRALNSPIYRDDVLCEIKEKYQQKVKAYIDDKNISIKNRSEQAKQLMVLS